MEVNVPTFHNYFIRKYVLFFAYRLEKNKIFPCFEKFRFHKNGKNKLQYLRVDFKYTL